MPLQSFRWNDDALPVVGQTASIGNHGYCTSTVGAETVTRPTGVIRSWRRRVPRSSIILVDVEVPALVQVAEEDRVEAVATPRASPSQVDVPTTMNAWTVLLTDFLPDESARPALGLSRLDRDHTLRSLAHSMTHLSEEDIVSLLWADSAMCKRVTGYAKPFVNTQAVAEFLGRIRYYREQARDAQERLDAYDRLLTGDP